MHEQTGQKTSPQAAQPGWISLCAVLDAQRQSVILASLLGSLLGSLLPGNPQGTGAA